MSNLGIFSLPKYVVLPILIEWLAMNELGSLDCAVCNVHLRKLFLMWIGGSEIAFSGTIHEKYNGQLYWQWLSLRDIPVNYISVYFQKFDHIVVRPKSFWERAYDNLLGQSSTLIVSKGGTPINLKLPLKLNSLFICAMENDHTRYLFPLTAQRLVSLKLTHFSVDVEEYVSEICNFMEKQYPSLKELIIQDCDPIPERVVLNVLRDCSELSHLFLVQRTSPNYKYVSPSVMRTVCQSWPDCFKLNTLSLCRLNGVCDELLLNLLPKCPLLQHIMIIECRITDRSVFLIAQTCSSVISIALEPLDQYRITGSPILAIAAYCKELEYWNVVQSSAEVRDFQIMIEECPKLRFLCCGYSRYNFTHHLKTRPHLRIEPDARLSGWFEPYPYTLPPSGR